MGNREVDYFINRYPLSLLYKFERVKKGEKEIMKQIDLHYETPIINSNSCLNNKKTIKYYFEKYLANAERLMDKHIVVNPNFTFDMLNETFGYGYTCEIYICEGIEKKPKKVLSFQDGDGLYPTYFIKGISPKLFRSPFKIHAKVNLFIIERRIE